MIEAEEIVAPATLVDEDSLVVKEDPKKLSFEFNPGDILTAPNGDQFRIEKKFDSNASNSVYLAYDLNRDRRVVIKKKLLDKEGKEARVTGQILSPYVVHVHDRFEMNGDEYIVMEWIEGSALNDWIKEEHTLLEKFSVIRQIAQVMNDLREGIWYPDSDSKKARPIIHHDFKPANLIISSQGRAKLTDFDIADVVLDDEGGIRGTWQYLSPEQANG